MRVQVWLGAIGFGVLAAAALGSANEINDRLVKGSDEVRRNVLQFLIGDGCVVTRTFFNGILRRGPAKGKAFWSAKCADGRSFMVMIPPRAEDTRILDCENLKELKLGTCFKKFR